MNPLLIGRWEYFKQNVGRSEAGFFINAGVGNMRLTVEPQDAWGKFKDEAIWGLFQSYGDSFTKDRSKLELNHESIHGQSPRQAWEKWVKAFQADPQLRNFAREYVERNLETTRKDLRWFLYLDRRFSKHL